MELIKNLFTELELGDRNNPNFCVKRKICPAQRLLNVFYIHYGCRILKLKNDVTSKLAPWPIKYGNWRRHDIKWNPRQLLQTLHLMFLKLYNNKFQNFISKYGIASLTTMATFVDNIDPNVGTRCVKLYKTRGMLLSQKIAIKLYHPGIRNSKKHIYRLLSHKCIKSAKNRLETAEHVKKNETYWYSYSHMLEYHVLS